MLGSFIFYFLYILHFEYIMKTYYILKNNLLKTFIAHLNFLCSINVCAIFKNVYSTQKNVRDIKKIIIHFEKLFVILLTNIYTVLKKCSHRKKMFYTIQKRYVTSFKNGHVFKFFVCDIFKHVYTT